jgi:hypothetical protein
MKDILRELVCRLVVNAVKKLPKDMVTGFYTHEAHNSKTGEKIGLDVGGYIGHTLLSSLDIIFVKCRLWSSTFSLEQMPTDLKAVGHLV